MFKKFVEFHKQVENELGYKIKCLRFDNGGEFSSKEFSVYTQEYGIHRQFSCPNTPQQNGIAKRKNRLLAEACRSMMHAKNVPT